MTFFTRRTDPALFACPCGCASAVKPLQQLLDLLDLIRLSYGQPITVTSGVRCRTHNHAVGGVVDSEHLTGEGADLAVTNGLERYRLLRAAFDAGASRLGVKHGAIHIGIGPNRPTPVLWTYDQ